MVYSTSRDDLFWGLQHDLMTSHDIAAIFDFLIFPKPLRGSDCKYRESLDKLKKIENPDNLPEEHLWGSGAIFENIT